MRFYSVEYCRRKADQHWEMAGLARQEGDKADADKHTLLAITWTKRVMDGGYQEEAKT